MAQGTAATVSLQSILNANPVWTRSDFGDMDSLIKDIEANGLRFPIAVLPDMLVIAGARRVKALQALGTEYVPVVIVQDWPQAMAAVRAGQEESYPMRWSELIDWWENILRPVNNKYRHGHSAVETRRRNRRGKSEELPTDRWIASGYSQFTQQLAEIHGIAPSAVKTLRDNWVLFQHLREPDPKFYGQLLKVMNEAMTNPENRHIDSARYLKAAIRRRSLNPAADTKMILDIFKRAMHGGPHQRQRGGNQYTTRESQIDSTAPQISKATLENLVVTLEQLATVAQTFKNIKLTPTDAKVLGARVDQACRKLQKMRRLVQNITLAAQQAAEQQQ